MLGQSDASTEVMRRSAESKIGKSIADYPVGKFT